MIIAASARPDRDPRGGRPPRGIRRSKFPMKHPARFVSVLALAAGLALAVPAAQAESEAGSAPGLGELLFETPHLSDVEPGTVLSYEFAHISENPSYGESFEDEITLTLEPGEQEASRNAVVAMFTGERRRAAGPFDNMTGNPLIMLFLQYESAEMSRLLGGNSFYIRNRIKDAMREGGRVEPARIDYDGREVEGWKVTFEPFIDDPNRAELREFVRKRYEFLLADDVPGGIYQIRTVTPRSETDDETLVSDAVTLASVEKDAAAAEQQN